MGFQSFCSHYFVQVKSEGRELHLQRVRKGDGGPFTCIVASNAGQDSLTYMLVVQGEQKLMK